MRRQTANLPDASLADRLIDAGERFVAQHGVEGISLRQINLAAGSKNSSAVQYHFGDSTGLIRAIVAKRVPEYELRRAHLLAALDDVKNADTRQLIEVIYRPFFEIDPVAARFGLQLRISPADWQDAVALQQGMEITWRVIDLLVARNPHLPPALVRKRLDRLAFLILSAACGPEPDDAALADTFRMAAAALSAPA